MTQTKAVEPARWGEFLSLFSNGNRGRRVSIESIDAAADSPLVSKAPLLAIDYDPAGKGSDVVVSLGRETLTASHVIPDPQELWEAADENGKVTGLEFVGAGGAKTILTFE